MRARIRIALVLVAVGGCGEEENGVGNACAEDDDCLNGQECVARQCTAVDSGRSRDIGRGNDSGQVDAPGEDSVEDGIASDTTADLAAEVTPDGCSPNCANQACGPDPVCGTECGPCPEDQECNASHVCVTSDGDPLDSLSPACATFCQSLCDFLLECGKDDPLCLSSCGASTRFQQLSPAACNEGTAAIQLEECPLWLNCGGQVCAIDEMCLQTLTGYTCALICDQQQTTPACNSPTTCRFITDANGSPLTSFGLCYQFGF